MNDWLIEAEMVGELDYIIKPCTLILIQKDLPL